MMFFRRLEYLLPWRRRAAERDMQEELRSIAAMADPRELGNLTLAAEDARAQWGWTWLEQTVQDVRYAVRTLAKAPGFTLAAVLSLAIGIGANTALFTLINTVMWKLLPVRDPEHLLTIAAQYPTGVTYAFTYQQYEIFRDHGGALDLAAYSPQQLDVSIDGQAEPTTDAHLVTGEYFPLLGLHPAARAPLRRERRPRPDGASGRRARATPTGNAASAPIRRSSAGRSRWVGCRSPSSASRRRSSSGPRWACRRASTCR